jgi:Xaa-Pro aminopeptidase
MSIELWKLPVAPTALIRSPSFAVRPKRQCEISLEFEGSSGLVSNKLLFEDVEAFRCTYLTFCTAEMFNTAYGKVVRLDANTQWLTEIKSPTELQHLMVCFDDGPCYEFICAGFRVS